MFCVKLWFRVLGSRLNRVLGSSLSRERAGWDLLHRGLGLGLGRGLLPHRLACRLGRLVKTCGKSYTADMWEVPHSRHVGSFPQPTCGKSNNRMFFYTGEAQARFVAMSDARGCCLILASYVPMHRKTSKVMCTRPRRHTLV